MNDRTESDYEKANKIVGILTNKGLPIPKIKLWDAAFEIIKELNIK